MNEERTGIDNLIGVLFGTSEDDCILDREVADERLAALGYDVVALRARFDAEAAKVQSALSRATPKEETITLAQMKDAISEMGLAARGFDTLTDDDVRRLYDELSKDNE